MSRRSTCRLRDGTSCSARPFPISCACAAGVRHSIDALGMTGGALPAAPHAAMRDVVVGAAREGPLPPMLRQGSEFMRACRSMDVDKRPHGGGASLGGAVNAHRVSRSALEDLMAPTMSRSISEALRESSA